MEWALQDAKNGFSKLVQKARTDGPQVVTLRGERAVVVLSADAFDELTHTRGSIVDHLLEGPMWDEEMAEAINRRDPAPSRDVAF